MSENSNVKVAVTGITPVASGDDWFVIDKSGTFSVDKDIVASVWLVGGGCDGGAGVWNGNDVDVEHDAIVNTGTGNSYSGDGGDGGYVLLLTNISISGNEDCLSVIAAANDRTGTSLTIKGTTYNCNDREWGSVAQNGGKGGIVPMASEGEQWADQSKVTLSLAGKDGILTPYGYVGSSGGGGAACNGTSDATNGIVGGIGAGSGTNHRDAGTDAANYGCGGGGGAVCGRVAEGFPGGKGKQGCIVVSYVVREKTLVVQKHYKRVCNTHKTCNTDYYSSNSRHSCCGTDSGSCGCGLGNTSGSGNSQEIYTDTVHVKMGSAALNDRAAELSNEIEAYDKEAAELQNKIDKLTGTVG